MTITDLIPSLKGKDNNYIEQIQDKFNKFKTASEIPVLYTYYKLNTDKCTRKIGILFNSIYEMVHNRYSYIFLVKDYNDIEKLSNCILDNYFKICIEQHCIVETVILIDAKLLMQDLKSYSFKDEDSNIALNYNINTINYNIKIVPLVMWYNLELLTSDYEMNKLQEILSYRHKRMLGNMYFLKQQTEIINHYSEELHKELAPDAIVDLQSETYGIESIVDRGQDIIW